jgi:lysophospholipase L1-like esterase
MKRIAILTVLMLTVNVLLYGQNPGPQVAGTDTYLSGIKKALTIPWPHNHTINLVFHGHSVPSGYRDKHEVHTLEAYPQLVLRALKEKYPYAVINIIVTAIGGENSVSGEARFEKDVLPHRPDVLFIDYALNDRGVGLEKARGAWEGMIKKAQEAGIKVILLTPSPDVRVDIFAKDSRSLEAHANQIRELAAQYHTGLADPFARFQEIARREGTIKPYMGSVNHPNDKGHQVIATEIMKWLAN